ncbi:hypothetical protein M5K25_001840 [Dendrobium thyrsiflorum]|uniref:DUF4283 domain-containing protein n=1 Tax=Dendrobium thyrsiflorum TaxID=117978 RepID=A0ABD0VRG1_DENTH
MAGSDRKPPPTVIPPACSLGSSVNRKFEGFRKSYSSSPLVIRDNPDYFKPSVKVSSSVKGKSVLVDDSGSAPASSNNSKIKISFREDFLDKEASTSAGHVLKVSRFFSTSFGIKNSGLEEVWIHLPQLPLNCWNEFNIAQIASRVGIPLFLYGNMFNWWRREFARICVRVNLDAQLPTGIWIEGAQVRFFQRIEYEKISSFCFSSGKIGHSHLTCKMTKGVQHSGSPLNQINGAKHIAKEVTDVLKESVLTENKGSEDANSYGPWIHVNCRRKNFNLTNKCRPSYQSRKPLPGVMASSSGHFHTISKANALEEISLKEESEKREEAVSIAEGKIISFSTEVQDVTEVVGIYPRVIAAPVSGLTDEHIVYVSEPRLSVQNVVPDGEVKGLNSKRNCCPSCEYAGGMGRNKELVQGDVIGLRNVCVSSVTDYEAQKIILSGQDYGINGNGKSQYGGGTLGSSEAGKQKLKLSKELKLLGPIKESQRKRKGDGGIERPGASSPFHS